MERKGHSKYEKLAEKVFDFVVRQSKKNTCSFNDAIASLELCKTWMQFEMIDQEIDDEDDELEPTPNERQNENEVSNIKIETEIEHQPILKTKKMDAMYC